MYVGEIFYKNGKRYKVFPSSIRKICIINSCYQPSSGNYCKKHKEEIIKDDEKKCNRCQCIRNIDQYINNSSYCQKCQENMRQKSLKKHARYRQLLLDYKIKMGGKCVDCGVNDLRILEFDHIKGDKINNVKRLYNLDKIHQEVKKCELRCVNCHMKKLPLKEERSTKRGQRAKNFVNSIKINIGKCLKCGWFDIKYLQVLHFDHIDRNSKKYTIGRLVSTGKSNNLILHEINKCQLLCANCHRIKTSEEINAPVLDLISNININV